MVKTVVLASYRKVKPEKGNDGKHVKPLTAGGMDIALSDPLPECRTIRVGCIEPHADVEPEDYDWRDHSSVEENIDTGSGPVTYGSIHLARKDNDEFYAFISQASWAAHHHHDLVPAAVAPYMITNNDGEKVFDNDKFQKHVTLYRKVNRMMAEFIVHNFCEDQENTVIEPHDAPVMGLARELRKLGFKGAIGYFHHIPWITPATLNRLPEQMREFFIDEMKSLEEANLIALQTKEHVKTFLSHINASPASNLEHYKAENIPTNALLDISKNGTQIGSFPAIGHYKNFPKLAIEGRKEAQKLLKLLNLGSWSEIVHMGNRADIAKMIDVVAEAGLSYVQNNLESASFTQHSAPSRTELEPYKKLDKKLDYLHRKPVRSHAQKKPARKKFHASRNGLSEVLFEREMQRRRFAGNATAYYKKKLPQPVMAAFNNHAKAGIFASKKEGMGFAGAEMVASANPKDPLVPVITTTSGIFEVITKFGAVPIHGTSVASVKAAINKALNLPLIKRKGMHAYAKKMLMRYSNADWQRFVLNATLNAYEAAKAHKAATLFVRIGHKRPDDLSRVCDRVAPRYGT